MSGAHAESGSGSEGHSGVGHVVPMRILLGVWGTLVVLTWATVAATYFDFGNMNIYIALGIAVVKSSLVVLYFMHLRYDNPFNGFVFVTSVLFLMLFISFLLIDTKEYEPEIIPGYAPRIEQAATAAASDAAASDATVPHDAGAATPPASATPPVHATPPASSTDAPAAGN